MLELVAKLCCSHLISTLTERYSETLVICLFVGSCAVVIAGSTEHPKTFPLNYDYCKSHICDRDYEAKCLVIFGANCIVSLPLCSKCSKALASGCARPSLA